jgi:hypothetical protein
MEMMATVRWMAGAAVKALLMLKRSSPAGPRLDAARVTLNIGLRPREAHGPVEPIIAIEPRLPDAESSGT